jgi:hypothetical protein
MNETILLNLKHPSASWIDAAKGNNFLSVAEMCFAFMEAIFFFCVAVEQVREYHDKLNADLWAGNWFRGSRCGDVRGPWNDPCDHGSSKKTGPALACPEPRLRNERRRQDNNKTKPDKARKARQGKAREVKGRQGKASNVRQGKTATRHHNRSDHGCWLMQTAIILLLTIVLSPALTTPTTGSLG